MLDKKRGIKNVTVSILFKIILLITGIWVRRYLIKYIGNEINGLNSLYISILDFLAVAELGVGSAITFCMYKPIVNGENDKVSALYGLFTKLYLIIGGIILICGCVIMPLLPYLAKDYKSAGVNLYLTFALTLGSVVLTYVFSSKTSLINAYKNNYITTTIVSLVTMLQYVLQIIVLVLTQSYIMFLICRIVAALIQWGITEVIARNKYGNIICLKSKIEQEEKREVTKNVKAMFMHKIGGVLVNTADSIIISAFIGIVVLGKYSNYVTIMVSLIGILALCFSPLTSVIGHTFVEGSKELTKKYLNFFHTFNFILGMVFFLGYYAIIDNLINILFGEGLELAKSISFVITLNYFIQFMRQSIGLFVDATGTFYNSRWKPLFEGIMNVGLSVLFVLVFPKEYNIIGVIVATILTNLFICHIVDPHVLFKYALNASAKRYYIKNYIYIVIFAVTLVVLHFTKILSSNQWVELFANGGISLAFSISISILVGLCDRDFRFYVKSFTQRIFKRNENVHNFNQTAVLDVEPCAEKDVKTTVDVDTEVD